MKILKRISRAVRSYKLKRLDENLMKKHFDVTPLLTPEQASMHRALNNTQQRIAKMLTKDKLSLKRFQSMAEDMTDGDIDNARRLVGAVLIEDMILNELNETCFKERKGFEHGRA